MNETHSPAGLTVFETPLGHCGLAWNERGLTAVVLPSRDAATVRARLPTGAAVTDPPPAIAAARDGIVALLSGKPADLALVPVDLDATPAFDRRVYEAARTVGAGAVTTYGDIATRIGVPREAREVGAALGRNRHPLVIPCHRVIAADGKLGGFSAPGGTATKRRLLELERAPVAHQPSLFAAAQSERA
jgi:methylated-DNA-[protein]-cysteine S-methyltransferase